MKVSNGALEILKWVGLLFMAGDHINKYLFNATLPVLFEAGRVALPIFIFVLAYNFSREGTLTNGVYKRAKKHLLVFGLVSSVPYIMLSGMNIKILPLNVLFTLLVITVVVENIDKEKPENYMVAVVAFVIGGAVVEYWWPAIALGVLTWGYLKTNNLWLGLAAVLSCTALYFVNGNLWALAAIPIIYLVINLRVTFPRIRWAFYAFYPLHLLAFVLIRIPLKNAGYLFF